LALPARATLDTFAPQLGDPVPGVVRRFSYEIVATNLTTRLLHTGGFKPQLPGKTYVNDMRFSTPGYDLHVNYYVSDGQWLTDADVKRLPEFAVAVGHASQTSAAFSRSGARGTRQVVWVVLALLAVLPVVYFFRERRRGGQ
jgi:outer membrane translocation and assembly module TamA